MSENSSGANWYLLRSGTQSGPFAKQTIIEFVRKAGLSPSDYVWRPGWEAWVQAGEVEGLFSPPSQASVYGFEPTDPNINSNELEREVAAFDPSKEDNLTRIINYNPQYTDKQESKGNKSKNSRNNYNKVSIYSYISATVCFIFVPIAMMLSFIGCFAVLYLYELMRPSVISSISWRQYDEVFDKIFYGNLIAHILIVVTTLFVAGYVSSWIVKFCFRSKATGRFTSYVSFIYALVWFSIASWWYFSYGISTDMIIFIIAYFGLHVGLKAGNDYYRPYGVSLD
jgi:hypothetical protein